MIMRDHRPAPERAFLVQIQQPRDDRAGVERLLAEWRHLAKSAGLVVCGERILSVSQPTPATYLGRGQCEEVSGQCGELEVDVLLFNHALTPIQQRNLEKAAKVKVVDRTGLILEIFAARARTREGTLQVQLASLLYQQSRLVRSWTHLERQRGGTGFMGGPGEAQIEIDRRLIREKIARLKKLLAQVEKTRGLHRSAREAVPYFTVALVGYTNAGKSTLFNRLTGSQVVARDQLFATLDSTLRAVALPSGGHVVLCDTVGFIRELPHQLVAAFRATLEEVVSADLLLLVADASDPEMESQMAAVERVLEEIHVHDTPRITLFNKIDRVAGENGLLERLASRPQALSLSSLTGEGMDALLAVLEKEASRKWERMNITLDVCDGESLARIHRQGHILARREEGESIHLSILAPPELAGRLKKFVPPS